ncbi:MAG TPA: DNA polymerase III subunit delta' [Verrucomicrobiae bacterium]|nr:DNA polymerase III subunit delta' [Verrucomicrobiae bacterium]
MGFTEIIGHQKQLNNLRAALAAGRLHHAYLFFGPEGVGKRKVALALARAIHCAAKDDDFCGRCVNCVRIAGGNHPDVRLIEPLADKKEIGIPQVRELERELHYRAFSGGRKVVIVDPATLMNSAAQNALLKTLEEPPEQSLIVLIAPNTGRLLPTVRSRCLPLSFAPLPRREVAAFLQSQGGMNAEEAEVRAAISMGRIGAAVDLEKDEWMDRRRSWSTMLGALKTGDYHGAMTAAETLAANRDEALKFLRWAESWYRDLSIHQTDPSSDDLVNLDMQAQIAGKAAELGVARALGAHRRIAAAAAGIQRNLNRRMVLEKFLFGVVRGR